ncbi:MAG: DNA polymerase III subunit alpha [Pseudomonadota bacterium]
MSAVLEASGPLAEPARPTFVHLRVHSEFSLSDSIVRIKALAAQVADQGMAAVAITDQGNLFALLKFYNACLSKGVKPIVGVDLLLSTGASEEDGQRARKTPRPRVTLLAQNTTGYQRLRELVSSCYVEGDEYGTVPREAVLTRTDGLIALCGGMDGEIGQALLRDDRALAEARLGEWASAYPDRFYCEISRVGRPQEEQHLRAAVELAAVHDVPVVATNPVCFLTAEDFEAHETRLCIQQSRTLDDPARERTHTDRQYLSSVAEMQQRFADLPVALANSVAVAARCTLSLKLGDYFLPNYPVPEGVSLAAFLEQCARDGLETRLLDSPPVRPIAEYDERLAFELGVINQMGFPGYFLIVMEFIQWAKGQAIPVGPGRGSGGGSLVAYALGITDLDPLAYDLLFERFLNPERVSMPDFDIDFCMEGRDRVIAHVSERYGHNAVSQIVTFGTMAAKAVVRDVARAQNKSLGLANRLANLIPFEVGMTLAKAVAENGELKEFIEQDVEAQEIMEMAFKLEGIVRNVGRHAGGVVIAPSALTDFVPLYSEELGAGLVSQFDKDDVETAGLVKFDFLGLKTLTIIDWAVAAVNANLPGDGCPVVLKDIPLDDRETYGLLRRADTTGVFQLESRGMKDLIKRLLPDSIEDIIALVALFRPGPLQSGAVDDFINRKHGREPVSFPHPSLEPVLNTTYGVILYQEQVMQIAQVLAGFSLGQADLLRRAMGKKKPEEMAKVREQYMAGVVERGIDLELAGQIFDLMEKFAGYAFNKSHSATYALVSFQTAWLKTHFPAHFMAATLSAELQNTDKIVTLIDETRRLGLVVEPPNVNEGGLRFEARGELERRADGSVSGQAVTRIVYGLGAIKGVGEGPVATILEERAANGPFVDLDEFLSRVDGRRLGRRVLEALIKAGAMDCLMGALSTDEARANLLNALPQALARAEQTARNAEAGMADLFGSVAVPEKVVQLRERVAPWRRAERLQHEHSALGLYLTGHPIDDYTAELKAIAPKPISALRPRKGRQRVAGFVANVRTMRNKKGELMGFVQLDDRRDRVECALFAEPFAEHRDKLGKDRVLVLDAEVQADEYSGGIKLRVARVYTVQEARAAFATALELSVRDGSEAAALLAGLRSRLVEARLPEQGCPLVFRLRTDEAEVELAAAPQWSVLPSDELLDWLRGMLGPDQVRLRYDGKTDTGGVRAVDSSAAAND